MIKNKKNSNRFKKSPKRYIPTKMLLYFTLMIINYYRKIYLFSSDKTNIASVCMLDIKSSTYKLTLPVIA